MKILLDLYKLNINFQCSVTVISNSAGGSVLPQTPQPAELQCQPPLPPPLPLPLPLPQHPLQHLPWLLLSLQPSPFSSPLVL